MAAGSPRTMGAAHDNISTTQPGPVLQAAAIVDLAALTGGTAPTEAQHNLVVAKVNAIIAALETSGVIAA